MKSLYGAAATWMIIAMARPPSPAPPRRWRRKAPPAPDLRSRTSKGTASRSPRTRARSWSSTSGRPGARPAAARSRLHRGLPGVQGPGPGDPRRLRRRDDGGGPLEWTRRTGINYPIALATPEIVRDYEPGDYIPARSSSTATAASAFASRVSWTRSRSSACSGSTRK